MFAVPSTRVFVMSYGFDSAEGDGYTWSRYLLGGHHIELYSNTLRIQYYVNTYLLSYYTTPYKIHYIPPYL